MTLDRETLAERVATVERHLARVATRLPERAEDLRPMTDEADAVILHLWQATQIVIDLALALCVQQRLGTPSSYADGFRRLHGAGLLEAELADRLARAAAFRNVVAHEYGALDLSRIHEAARRGPDELRSFMGVVARLV